MKKILTVVLPLCIAFLILCASIVIFFNGCDYLGGNDGRDGRDGKDGTSVTIYDAYEAAKSIEGNENLTFDEFLKEYLSYTESDISIQTSINNSLMSGVTILTRFKYKTNSYYGSSYTYKIYTGSGVILWLDKEAGDAYVVTNCHVIYDDTSSDSASGQSYISEYIRLYLYGQDVDGVNYDFSSDYSTIYDEGYGMEAQVIGASVSYDIALLKVTNSEVIKRSDARAASFSQSEDVYLGEPVYAIGNAGGEGMSAADGIISKDSEYIELNLSDKYSSSAIDYRVMRTTAPINHGNSGGGLFNARGEIVGIVNAKDDSSDVDNFGYALPGNIVRRLVKLMYDSYVSNGNRFVKGVKKAYLNVKTSVSDSYARYDSDNGYAVITELLCIASISGAPANGNLEAGDIITSVRIVGSDGIEKENLLVTREYHLKDVLFSVRQGDTVTIGLERNKEDKTISIKFDSSSYFQQLS